MNYLALKVTYRHTWGYRISYPYQSSAQATLTYPPPSTLIGALAYPFFMNLNYPEAYRDKEVVSVAYKLARNIISVNFSYSIDENHVPIKYGDISRLSTISYLEPKFRKDMKFWFAIQSMEKVFYTGKSDVVYLIDIDSLISETGAKDIAKLIETSAYTINRVGSRESVVSVERVVIDMCELSDPPNKISTRFYFPIPDGPPLTRTSNYIITSFWNYRDKEPYTFRYRGKPIHASEVDYLVPVDPRLKLQSDYVEILEPKNYYTFSIEGDSILVPKRWVY